MTLHSDARDAWFNRPLNKQTEKTERPPPKNKLIHLLRFSFGLRLVVELLQIRLGILAQREIWRGWTVTHTHTEESETALKTLLSASSFHHCCVCVCVLLHVCSDHQENQCYCQRLAGQWGTCDQMLDEPLMSSCYSRFFAELCGQQSGCE